MSKRFLSVDPDSLAAEAEEYLDDLAEEDTRRKYAKAKDLATTDYDLPPVRLVSTAHRMRRVLAGRSDLERDAMQGYRKSDKALRDKRLLTALSPPAPAPSVVVAHDKPEKRKATSLNDVVQENKYVRDADGAPVLEAIIPEHEFRNLPPPGSEPLPAGHTRAVTTEGVPAGPSTSFVDPVRARPKWDREDLPAWVKDQVKPPRWWGWKFITTTFSTTGIGPNGAGQYANLVVQGTDENQRIGKAVIFVRMEYRFRFSNAVSTWTTRAQYTIDGVGTGSSTSVKGTVNPGWTVPDAGPGASTLYPNFCIVRGAGGYSATANAITESDPTVDINATVGCTTGQLQAAATPNVGTLAIGDNAPVIAAAGAGYPGSAATPPAPVAFTQTIPNIPPANIRFAQDYQQYGPKGYTVAALVGSQNVTVPANIDVRGYNAGSMSAVRILVVWSRGDFTTASPPVASLNYVQPITGTGGTLYSVAAPYNMDELRGTFEVLSDTTWTPQGQDNECVLVEEGVRLYHPSLYPDPASGLASYGQILVFLWSGCINTSRVQVDSGYVRLWYKDASDERSSLNN